MNGEYLTKTFVNTIRIISRSDELLLKWEQAFWKKYEQRLRSRDATATDLCFQFMYMIAVVPMNLHYRNKYFFFQSNNDVMKLSVSEFADVDYAIFLKRWSMLFKTKVSFVDDSDEFSDSEKNETVCSEYKECLHNDIVESHFPRIHMVARYMCLCLRKSLILSDNKGYVNNIDDFGKMRNMFLKVADKFLLADKGRHVGLGRLLLDILYNRLERIYFDWNPDEEVYPAFMGDHKI
jgi:hypothetical protein